MSGVMAEFEILLDVPKPKFEGLRSGYSPTHVFQNVEYYCSGKHIYDNDRLHYPGEKILALIDFVSWEYIYDRLTIGDVFYITEVQRMIGYCKILDIDYGSRTIV